ncbi:MAG: hypothetical protein M3Z09_09025 [Acidobacteriota bacterium]|nr:hypothetical protein [Acidobacteriota bacterium]
MILAFIKRARLRYLWNEVLAQFAFTAALLLGGVILLLLAGTQLLDWRLVVLLAGGGLGLGLYRTIRRMPSPYHIAVLVDSRAGLHDALSTALFFSEPRAGAISGVREFQKTQAEQLIPAVNLDAAVPFRIPRALYAMGVLGLIASSLFALRYGIRRSLDFKAPFTQVVMDGLGLHAPEDKLASARKKQGGNRDRTDTMDEQGMQLPRSQQKRAGELEPASASALEQIGVPDVNNDKVQTAAGKEGQGKADGSDKEGGEKGSSDSSDNGQPAAGKSPADDPAGSREGPQQGEQGASQQGGQGANSNLLSKMKDAMQNLLSKAKPQPNGAAGQKAGAGQQKGESQQAKSGEKGSPGQSKDGGRQENAEGQDGQQPGDQDNAESSQGKGSGKSSDQQAAAQPGSGIGKQDGAKDVKAAEQKAAMGKLSEVMGKRSANVSGEMMVESQSGPQQLHTQYSHRNAAHGASTGEVSRDEVPVELQGYVQNYFEEVRKAERAGAAARKVSPEPLSPQPK